MEDHIVQSHNVIYLTLLVSLWGWRLKKKNCTMFSPKRKATKSSEKQNSHLNFDTKLMEGKLMSQQKWCFCTVYTHADKQDWWLWCYLKKKKKSPKKTKVHMSSIWIYGVKKRNILS